MEKECSKCHVVKPYSYFSPHGHRKDGLHPLCNPCKDLQKIISKEKAREGANRRRKKYYEKSKNKEIEYAKKWAKENSERVKETRRKRAIKKKSHINETSRNWHRKNPDKSLMYCRNRNARKLKALPGWADIIAINDIYKLAKSLNRENPKGYHVDHIVPLKSNIVCGLHVESNLQILSASQNCVKGNREWPNMPD